MKQSNGLREILCEMDYKTHGCDSRCGTWDWCNKLEQQITKHFENQFKEKCQHCQDMGGGR